MDLQEFQTQCQETDLVAGNILYHLLGALSEIGEALEHVEIENTDVARFAEYVKELAGEAAAIKRSIRDAGNTIFYTVCDKKKLESESLDLLWYAVQMISAQSLTLDEGAKRLRNKLYSRRARNMLHGSGSDR